MGPDSPPPGDDSDDWIPGCADDTSEDLPSGMTWQWQLTDTVDLTPDVEMFDVDLFDTTSEIVASLHADGRTVICHFSAGTYQSWREEDRIFPENVKGEPVDGWTEERWLDVNAEEVRNIMSARLDTAQKLQCDGVEPDNVDGYANPTGFSISADDQLVFNSFIAEEAHHRGLSVGLKNDVEQIDKLEPCFDWALNEECLVYGNCARYKPFLDSGKAVFHVEYVDNLQDGPNRATEVCSDPLLKGFSTSGTCRLGESPALRKWIAPSCHIRCFEHYFSVRFSRFRRAASRLRRTGTTRRRLAICPSSGGATPRCRPLHSKREPTARIRTRRKERHPGPETITKLN